MINTLTLNVNPFQTPKFNTSLLSVISLIVLCAMLFLLMSYIVDAHNTNAPDCNALKQTIEDKMNGVTFATASAGLAGLAVAVSCSLTVYGLVVPPVSITAGIACLAAIASFGTAIWWVDVKKKEFDRALAHYNEHCPPLAYDSGSCSG